MAIPPLKIANIMAQAAQKKSQQPSDQDADDMPGQKKPKQVAAAKEQEKSKGKKPPQSKKPMPPKGGLPPMQGGM